jgi:hypothetical protein
VRREVVLWSAAGFLVICLAGGFLLIGKSELDGSSLSRGSTGYLAARRYLEARGCRVALLDHPLSEESVRGVLTTVFPWQVPEFAGEELRQGLESHLRRGGAVLLAVSGDRFAQGQEIVLQQLQISWQDLRGRPPLLPWRWWRYASVRWPMSAPYATGEIEAPRGFPTLPKGGRALWLGEKGVPLVFTFGRSGGRVFVVPADALSNGRLGRAENVELLEELHRTLGNLWAFDEYHHALFAPTAPSARVGVEAFEALLIHLGLLYAMAVLALGRRFGTPWREESLLPGSTASFLVGLGALHQRLGHHPAAARLLLERARELDPRVRVPVQEEPVLEGQALTRLAARVSDAQARKGGSGW